MIKEEYRGRPLADLEAYGNDIFEGFCIDMLKEISEIVHFDYKVVPVPDKRYGIFKDGQWDGIVRQLIDRVSFCIIS